MCLLETLREESSESQEPRGRVTDQKNLAGDLMKEVEQKRLYALSFQNLSRFKCA
jgi:hypothetical protein